MNLYNVAQRGDDRFIDDLAARCIRVTDISRLL